MVYLFYLRHFSSPYIIIYECQSRYSLAVYTSVQTQGALNLGQNRNCMFQVGIINGCGHLRFRLNVIVATSFCFLMK